VVTIDATQADVFAALLEYIYTDHAPIATTDAVALMVLANRFGLSRLVTLCELYLTKVVEKETTNDIIKAQIDVIGLLHIAQKHNAKQLTAFLLHFVSANYQLMKQRKEFATLEGETLKHVEANQWPPKNYLKEVAEYEKLVKGTSSENTCVIC